MKYAEIIFETGSKSVLGFESQTDLEGFLKEHNKRAQNGEDGGPGGNPAERVKRVILYDSHPADYAGNAVDKEKLQELLDGMGDVVDANQLISALRDEASPIYPVSQGRHESLYKMSGTEMDLSGVLD